MQLQVMVSLARSALIAFALIVGALAASSGPAQANLCKDLSGKPLYNCLAAKLDHIGSMSSRSPETQAVLQTAATQLRAAVSKSQALSAISQCRSAVAGIVEKIRSAGYDSSGFLGLTRVLATAARLVQEKG